MKTIFILLGTLALMALNCQKALNPVETTIAEQSVDGSLAKAIVSQDNITMPFEGYLEVPCALGGTGEWIHAVGGYRVLTHLTINENTWQLKTHEQPLQEYIIVGLTTGDRYLLKGASQYHEHQGNFVNEHAGFTYVLNWHLNGQGPGNNFTWKQTLQMTINANGVVTAEVIHERIECK